MHRGLARESEGSQVAEAALVLPLMFTLLLGIFWLGRAYNIYSTMNQAAHVGAQVAARSSCATCGSSSLTGSQVATTYIAPVLQASGLDVNRVSAATPPAMCQCGVTNCSVPVSCDASGLGAVPSVCVQYNVDIGTSNYVPPTCGTVVSFQYPFSLPLMFAPPSMQNITIRTQVASRVEQ